MEWLVAFGFLAIVLIAWIIQTKFFPRKRRYSVYNPVRYSPEYKNLPRNDFSSETRNTALHQQGHRCNHCTIQLNPIITKFDHFNGDKSDNSLSNCQVLCANCHRAKTNEENSFVKTKDTGKHYHKTHPGFNRLKSNPVLRSDGTFVKVNPDEEKITVKRIESNAVLKSDGTFANVKPLDKNIKIKRIDNYSSDYSSTPRKTFETGMKNWVRQRQGNKCYICKINLSEIVEFDHINGDKSDNSFGNCQALCASCHSEKTFHEK